MKVSTFYLSKETLAFLAGMTSIVGILIFYSVRYHQQSQLQEADKAIVEEKNQKTLEESDFIFPEDAIRDSIQNAAIVDIIDIRSNDLFAYEHIPLSTNVPIDTIADFIPKNDRHIIIIASAGNEQGEGNLALQSIKEKSDQSSVKVLRGGFEGWQSFGGQTLSFGNPESIVHQSKVSYITSEELLAQNQNKRKILLLDMRTASKYADGHLPQALNLPLDELEQRYRSLPTGANIVAYGGSALEDFQAGVRLIDLGFFSTRILKGGFDEWKAQGFSIER